MISNGRNRPAPRPTHIVTSVGQTDAAQHLGRQMSGGWVAWAHKGLNAHLVEEVRVNDKARVKL